MVNLLLAVLLSLSLWSIFACDSPSLCSSDSLRSYCDRFQNCSELKTTSLQLLSWSAPVPLPTTHTRLCCNLAAHLPVLQPPPLLQLKEQKVTVGKFRFSSETFSDSPLTGCSLQKKSIQISSCPITGEGQESSTLHQSFSDVQAQLTLPPTILIKVSYTFQPCTYITKFNLPVLNRKLAFPDAPLVPCSLTLVPRDNHLFIS